MPSFQLLPILLFMYGAVVLINLVLSLALWFCDRERFHALTIRLWFAMFANFMLQGVFTQLNFWTVLAYSTYFMCTQQLIQILSLATEIRFPHRTYDYLMAVTLAAAAVAAALNLPFFWIAIFPAVGMSFPMFHSSWKTVQTEMFHRDGMIKIFVVLLVLNAIHFLDYPFLRHSDANAVVGFSVALLFLFCFSIFMPTYSIGNIGARYSQQLEHEVARRTESLTIANSSLKVLSDEHDHLLRLVVHDIANPLTVVDSSLRKLGKIQPRTETTDPVRLIYERIRLCIRSISEVLENVRSIHALRTGKVLVKLVPVSISEILREQLGLFEAKLQAKQLSVRIEEKQGPDIDVLADPSSLKNHVLSNLISNAVKFSEPGGEIVISVEDEGTHVGVSITDSGIGIPPGLMTQIFDVNKPTSRPGTSGEKGTGFGMPIVKKFLDQYGAEISVTSKDKEQYPQDHGTEFRIQFKKAA